MQPRLAAVRQGKVAEVREPYAGLIDVLLGVAEPRTLRMVGAVLRSAARIAARQGGRCSVGWDVCQLELSEQRPWELRKSSKACTVRKATS
jgi:hypothetical protein